MVFNVLKSTDLTQNGLQVLPYFFAKIAINNIFKRGYRFSSRVGHPALVNAQVTLNYIKPTHYLHLRDQYAFQQFFSFSHVVFLLLVDGVATTTLAGDGVAFYSVDMGRGRKPKLSLFVRLNQRLIVGLRQSLKVHVGDVHSHLGQLELCQLANQSKSKLMGGNACGYARCPVVDLDGSGNEYVSICVEGKACPTIGISPVVAIAGDNELAEGINQHPMKRCYVCNARLWQVAKLSLHLLKMVPALVVGVLIQLPPLITRLETTNIAMLHGCVQFLFSLKHGVT